METPEIISIAKDAVVGLSALAVAIIALVGLTTWRRELTGRARFETASNMMRICYRLRADFSWVRHIITRHYEWAGRPKQENEVSSESPIYDEWYAKNNRLSSVVESLNKATEAQWEAEILLDEVSIQEVRAVIKSYRESYADLASAIESYFDVRRDEAKSSEPYKDQDWLRELRNIIYSSTDDDFSKKVDDATNRISKTLKKFVR